MHDNVPESKYISIERPFHTCPCLRYKYIYTCTLIPTKPIGNDHIRTKWEQSQICESTVHMYILYCITRKHYACLGIHAISVLQLWSHFSQLHIQVRKPTILVCWGLCIASCIVWLAPSCTVYGVTKKLSMAGGLVPNFCGTVVG